VLLPAEPLLDPAGRARRGGGRRAAGL